MTEFKVGDKVRVKGDEQIHIITSFYNGFYDNRYNYWWVLDNYYCYDQYNLELVSSNNITKPTGKNIMSIKQIFKNLTIGEPEKSYRKCGIQNENGEYTQEAKDIALEVLCESEAVQEAFKKVVEESKKEEDKK